jgi:hypothetical protein
MVLNGRLTAVLHVGSAHRRAISLLFSEPLNELTLLIASVCLSRPSFSVLLVECLKACRERQRSVPAPRTVVSSSLQPRT